MPLTQQGTRPARAPFFPSRRPTNYPAARSCCQSASHAPCKWITRPSVNVYDSIGSGSPQMRHGSRVARPTMVRVRRRLRPRMTFSACGGCGGSSPEAINSRILARRAASDIKEGIGQEWGHKQPHQYVRSVQRYRSAARQSDRWDFRQSSGRSNLPSRKGAQGHAPNPNTQRLEGGNEKPPARAGGFG